MWHVWKSISRKFSWKWFHKRWNDEELKKQNSSWRYKRSQMYSRKGVHEGHKFFVKSWKIFLVTIATKYLVHKIHIWNLYVFREWFWYVFSDHANEKMICHTSYIWIFISTEIAESGQIINCELCDKLFEICHVLFVYIFINMQDLNAKDT